MYNRYLIQSFFQKNYVQLKTTLKLFLLSFYMLYKLTVAITKVMRFTNGTEGDQGCKFNIKCPTLSTGVD